MHCGLEIAPLGIKSQLTIEPLLVLPDFVHFCLENTWAILWFKLRDLGSQVAQNKKT